MIRCKRVTLRVLVPDTASQVAEVSYSGDPVELEWQGDTLVILHGTYGRSVPVPLSEFDKPPREMVSIQRRRVLDCWVFD